LVQVKRNLIKDPRYDALGSSTLREELFATFLKALSSGTSPNVGTSEQSSFKEDAKPKDDRKLRAERALRDREEQTRAERGKIERDIGRSKAALGSVESEEDLMSFYVDCVRDPLVCAYGVIAQGRPDYSRYLSPLAFLPRARAHIFETPAIRVLPNSIRPKAASFCATRNAHCSEASQST
jgi:hypothetical protein